LASGLKENHKVRNYLSIRHKNMKIFSLDARKRYPTKLTIDINTGCNASCIICPYPILKNKIKHGLMQWGLYTKIIDNYSQLCYTNKVMGELSFCNMSEPTLSPNFPQFIKYARDKGCFTIYFNTNVSGLSPKLIDLFIKDRTFPAIHLNIVALSIQRYRELMGLEFNNVMENLKYLLLYYPYSLIDVGFFSPLLTKAEIDEILKFFKSTKVTVNYSDSLRDRAQNIKLPNNLSTFSAPIKRYSFACMRNQPIMRMMINFEGFVYLCDEDMRQEVIWGDLKKNSIEDIWNSEKVIEVLKEIYGLSQPRSNLPCYRCIACVDDKSKLKNFSKVYKPKKLFNQFKQWLVKKGVAVIGKRGKLYFR
jgi:radical SAM protein with 4Fe4S-binding SPASM domain